MFILVTGVAEVGGSLSFQKETMQRAKSSLETQLNALKGVKSFSAPCVIEHEHAVEITVLVEIEGKPKSKAKEK